MAIGTPTERYASELNSQTGTSAFSPATTVAAGSKAFVFGSSGSNKSITEVTDSVGNTWAVDKTNGDGTRVVSIASCQVATQITSSDTITITWSAATSNSARIWVQEVTGLATSSAFDTFAVANATGTAYSCGPTATLAQADEIVWSLAQLGSAAVWTKDATYSNPTTNKLGAGSAIATLQYKIVSSTAAETATGTWGTSAAWVGVVGTFTMAAAAATTKHNLALMGVR